MSLNADNEPPPPPPLLVLSPDRTLTKISSYSSSQNEVTEACKRLFGSRLNSLPAVICFYKSFDAVIQNGPKCGLVAIQMAAQALKCSIPSMEQILNLGRELKYTIQGEMFSAKNLANLIQQFLPCHVEVVSEGLNSRLDVIRHLIQGNIILIPYDTDRNFEPCCRNGHKAHWAVLGGIVFIKSNLPHHLASDLVKDEYFDNVFHGKSLATNDVEAYIDSSEIYLLAKQGKSRHLRLWDYDTLHASNSNLTEVDPAKESNPTHYVIPAGGIQDGLCKKLIILYANI